MCKMFHLTLSFQSVLYVSTESFKVKMRLVNDTSNISIPIIKHVIFQFLMTYCSSKSIHVLNKSTIITNINVKGALSCAKVIQSLININCFKS